MAIRTESAAGQGVRILGFLLGLLSCGHVPADEIRVSIGADGIEVFSNLPLELRALSAPGQFSPAAPPKPAPNMVVAMNGAAADAPEKPGPAGGEHSAGEFMPDIAAGKQFLLND